MISDLSVSVIIPVKNGSKTLDKCLGSIREQKGVNIKEILILDSCSKDESRQISSAYDVRIIDINASDFNHGITRNIGVANAMGDLLFFTVQDAWFSNNTMLHKMAAHFSDNEVMAVGGQQVVPATKKTNPLSWYQPKNKHKVYTKPALIPNTTSKIDNTTLWQIIGWDNVISLYRKSALTRLPFKKCSYAEDIIWCFNAVSRGWKVLFDSGVLINHYHHQSRDFAAKSFLLSGYNVFYHTGIKKDKPAPVYRKIAQVFYHLMRNDKLSFHEKLYWIRYNINFILGVNDGFALLEKKTGLYPLQTPEELLAELGQLPQGKQKSN